jgi:hypothetical protein
MKNRFKILVPIIVIISLSLIGCVSNSKKISNQKVETFSQVKTNDLMKYKGSYVGDNSAVRNIIAELPANVYSAGFSLQTNKKPYGIIINYKENQNLGSEDYNNFWNNKKPNEILEKNAVILFSLIQNSYTIEFNVDNIGKKSYKYNRKVLERKYGGDFKKILKNETSFKNFLNKN